MLVATILSGLLLAGPGLSGCSAKPARKKGKSKAAAARAREEKPLVETPPESTATPESANSPAAPAADAPAPDSPDAAPATDAEAETAGEGHAPPDAPAGAGATSDTRPLGEGVVPPAARDPKRPVSPLIDPDTAILLDGGRVEVSSPKGWARAPRSHNYLVRYQPGPRKSIPSIVVTAEPAPEGLEAVTRKNQDVLVGAITTKLAADFPAGGTVKVIKKPAATVLGPHFGVAWAVPGSAKIDGLTETIDRFAWAIVLGGRLYVVEVRGPRAKLDEDAKDRAKAVAATLFRPADAPEGNHESTPAASPAGPEPD